MVSDEHIRELCARVVGTSGSEFQDALLELQEAIELRLGPDEQNSEKRSKK
ncbi:MAG TPA: hypothetical protein VKW06_02515 [Candidatus Angelobacter sp.]|nr:hypothetical protein [Candidatus Angelobacter sp.]